MESDVTTRKWAYNPSIGVLGYGAIPYEGKEKPQKNMEMIKNEICKLQYKLQSRKQ